MKIERILDVFRVQNINYCTIILFPLDHVDLSQLGTRPNLWNTSWSIPSLEEIDLCIRPANICKRASDNKLPTSCESGTQSIVSAKRKIYRGSVQKKKTKVSSFIFTLLCINIVPKALTVYAVTSCIGIVL